MTIQYKTTLDRTFHALGDGTRRQMVASLAINGTQSAGDLGKPFDVAQPTLSKHLKVLEKAGLVSRTIKGRVHRFKLDPKPLEELEDWLSRHKSFWEGTLDGLGSYLDNLDMKEDDT